MGVISPMRLLVWSVVCVRQLKKNETVKQLMKHFVVTKDLDSGFADTFSPSCEIRCFDWVQSHPEAYILLLAYIWF